MLGHKTDLNKFKRIEIIQTMLSNHNGLKLDINNRKKFGDETTHSLITNIAKKKSQGKLENTLNEMKNTSNE